jgi:DNA-directed RNA polymerase subunit M/transcription elongation factor TFIIS
MPRKKKDTVIDKSTDENNDLKESTEFIEGLIKKKKSQKKIKIKEIPQIEYFTPEYIAPEFKEPEPLYKYSDQISRHPFRSRVYNKFFTLLQLHSNLDKDKLQSIALNIEKSIFNYVLSTSSYMFSQKWDALFQNKYISCSVKVYSNLNPNSILKNTNLIKRLFNNEIKEYDIVKFSPQEMFPERHKELTDIIAANTPKVAPKLKLEDMNDGAFKCGRCKSWKTEYTEVQTRSAKFIGLKSTLLITSWLCYWKNSYSPSLILKC